MIPTTDGGQATIREPTKVALSGTKSRQLRELTAEQKSTQRLIKNIVVVSLCGSMLAVLFWWLLASPPV